VALAAVLPVFYSAPAQESTGGRAASATQNLEFRLKKSFPALRRSDLPLESNGSKFCLLSKIVFRMPSGLWTFNLFR
jgi:hypothetical protein